MAFLFWPLVPVLLRFSGFFADVMVLCFLASSLDSYKNEKASKNNSRKKIFLICVRKSKVHRSRIKEFVGNLIENGID